MKDEIPMPPDITAPEHLKSGMKKQCPICGSKDVAKILWGYPYFTDELKKDLDSKKITLGGCCISGEDPKWECNKCGYSFGLARH